MQKLDHVYIAWAAFLYLPSYINWYHPYIYMYTYVFNMHAYISISYKKTYWDYISIPVLIYNSQSSSGLSIACDIACDGA